MEVYRGGLTVRLESRVSNADKFTSGSAEYYRASIATLYFCRMDYAYRIMQTTSDKYQYLRNRWRERCPSWCHFVPLVRVLVNCRMDWKKKWKFYWIIVASITGRGTKTGFWNLYWQYFSFSSFPSPSSSCLSRICIVRNSKMNDSQKQSKQSRPRRKDYTFA